MSDIYPIVKNEKLTRRLLKVGVIVIVAEIVATFYAFAGLFGVVPITIPIFAFILSVLVMVNLLLFASALKARESIGIRTTIALIVWSGMVFGYWVFAPIYYFLTMYFDALQLKWVVFAFIWEVPVVGGIFILIVVILFRPLHRFLEGKSQDISPDEFYKRLNAFPIIIGILLFVVVVFGYVIGTLQQKYFGHMPLIEQFKNITNGAISSILVGVFLSLLSDTYLNRVRFYVNQKFQVRAKPVNKFTSKIVISTLLIIVAGIGMSGMLSFKSAQGLIRQLVVEESREDFNIIISADWDMLGEKDKNAQLDHLRNESHGEIHIGESSLDKIGVLESTKEYISTHSEGVIDDYQHEIKTIVFEVKPTTGEKIISVLYLADHYTKLQQGLIFSFFGGLFVLVTSGLSILFYKKSISRPLSLIQKNIIDGSTNTQIVDLATGDEFEQLSDAIISYKLQLQQSSLDLEKKVAEQTEELSEQLSEIGKKNAFLEDTKKAMMNVLEDARILEAQLKEEKAGVEKKVIERTEALSRAKDDISKGWLQIQQEKVRLTASIFSLPLGFVMTDANSNVLIHNPMVTKILDLHGDELKISDIDASLGNSLNLLSALRRSMVEKKLLLANDVQVGSKHLKLSIVPIITNHTEVIGTVMLVEDTTEAKVLERSRNEFFSIASHELRTPLTSIKGNTSLIQQYYSDALKDPSLKEMIDDIHLSSNRLIMIVNDFLDVSRIEQGRITYKVEKVDILDLVLGVVKDVQANATTKGIGLNVENESTNYIALADKDRTQQIVYNLIGNAIKFTDKGAVKINIKNSETYIEVRIIDTGAGISVESKTLLFRKFQQAQDNPLTRKSSSGTGLGLYISKTLAQGMKGDVILENSEANVGSTFLLTIPIAK